MVILRDFPRSALFGWVIWPVFFFTISTHTHTHLKQEVVLRVYDFVLKSKKPAMPRVFITIWITTNYDILFEHVKMFFLNIGYLLCCNNEWLVTSTKKKIHRTWTSLRVYPIHVRRPQRITTRKELMVSTFVNLKFEAWNLKNAIFVLRLGIKRNT